MLDSKYASIAGLFFKPVKYLFGWIVGFFLFLFIIVYLVFSFFRKQWARLLHLPGLYHFRENQFPLLDVTPKGDEKNIFLGDLPTSKNVIVRHALPAIEHARELLLELKLESIPESCMELGYFIYSDEMTDKKEYVYFFIHALPAFPGLNYNSARCWVPLPANNALNAELTDIITEQPGIDFNGALSIVTWR